MFAQSWFLSCTACIDALPSDCQIKTSTADAGQLVVIQFLVLRVLVAILRLIEVPQFGGQLAAPVQSLRALVEKIVIAKDLPDFRQINHVAIVQAVIV